MKSFAIVSAAGIGDALLMQICAHHLQKLGHPVTHFSNHLPQLQKWFPGFSFAPYSSLESFDAILLQHDNSEKAKQICSLSKPVYALYGSHNPSKHGPFRSSFDFVFNRTLPMAENMRLACGRLFPGIEATIENGLKVPTNLTFSRYPKRVAIHPTSSSPDKNWLRSRFLKLREKLAQAGYDPVFIASLEGVPLFPTLSELAAFLYESGLFIGNDSGPGHLASNLGLPTVTIGPSQEQLQLWRPAWGPNSLAFPPKFVEKTKLTRDNWRYFITVDQVIKHLTKLTAIK